MTRSRCPRLAAAMLCNPHDSVRPAVAALRAVRSAPECDNGLRRSCPSRVRSRPVRVAGFRFGRGTEFARDCLGFLEEMTRATATSCSSRRPPCRSRSSIIPTTCRTCWSRASACSRRAWCCSARAVRSTPLGEGLLTSEGDYHLRQRHRRPAFHRGERGLCRDDERVGAPSRGPAGRRARRELTWPPRWRR